MSTAVTTRISWDQLAPIINSLESSLHTAIDGLSATTISQQALLQLQSQMQEWSTAISLLAALNKEIADTLKGLIQKF